MADWKIRGGLLWNGTAFEKNPGLLRHMEGEEERTVDLMDDDLILPGVIDPHVHLWSPASISKFGIPADGLYADGIVGAVEPGSFGCRNWGIASRYWTNALKTKVRSFMHIIPEGFAVFPPNDVTLPKDIDVDEVAAAAEKDRTGTLLGFKVHLGFLYFKSEETDRGQLEKAREAADRTGKRVLAHISGSTIPIREVLTYLKPGDIITHTYTGFEKNIFDGGDTLIPEILEAKKRGVLLDVGHAAKHFSWDVFRKAYAAGLTFDTISTDLTVFSYHQPETHTLNDLYHLLAAFLACGIDRDSVFRAVTEAPSRIYGIPLDMEKQLLILRKQKCALPLSDGLGQLLEVPEEYRPYCFLDSGKVISASREFGI